ncbi:MAG: polysaccharide pyruvyl transferase family protein [Pseudomonadota bacterium]
MKVFFCKVDGGNFGDDMNEWFWDELFPGHRDIAQDRTLFGIGSILWRQNFLENKNAVVMGSGSGYGVVPNELPPGAEVGFVRGPRTARLLGLAPEQAITDPAAMVSTFGRFSEITANRQIIFIPHVGTAKLPLNWERAAERAGIHYVSPARDSQEVIRTIAGSRLVLTESLHGAIVADAFRVPFVPVSISPTFNEHKWKDWAESLLFDVSFRTILGSLTETPQRLARLKRAFWGPHRTPPGPVDARSHANGTRVARVVSADEKHRARKWASWFSPIIETMLTRDLKKVAGEKGYLSRDRVLRERQVQILDRVDEMRNRLTI